MPKDEIDKPELSGLKTYQQAAEKLDAKTHSGGMHMPRKTTLSRTNDSILTNKDDVFDVSGAFDMRTETGTIVTDKRKKKSRAGHIITTAFREWFEGAKESVERNVDQIEFLKKKEKAKIIPAEERKDVIEAAAKHTRHVPKDDHKVVVEKLKTFQRDSEHSSGKPFHIKEKEEAKAPSWTYVVDQEKLTEEVQRPTPLDMRQTAIAPRVHERANTEDVERRVAKNIQHATKEKKAKAKSSWSFFRTNKPKEETVPSNSKPVERQPSVEEKPAIPTPPPVPKKESVPKDDQFHNRTVESTPPVVKPIPRDTKERTVATPPKTSRSNIILIVVGILIVGALGVVSSLLLVKQIKTDETIPETTIAPSLISADEQIPVSLGTTRNELLTSLNTALRNSNTNLVEVYPVVGDTRATTHMVFDVLKPQAPGAFIRSLGERSMFGTIEREPFIILTTTSFDTAFAGMISWEPYLFDDIKPFFGEDTFIGNFTDTTLQNISVRVLKDTSGRTHVVYGFVGRNRLLITTSENSFEQLIGRVR